MYARTWRPRAGARLPQYLAELINTLPDVLFRYRLHGDAGFQYISPAVAGLTGYSAKRFYAAPRLAATLCHPADRARIRRAIESGTADPAPILARVVHTSGTVIRVELRLHLVRGASGQLMAIQGIVRDVTLSQIELKAAREERKTWRTVFDHAPVGIAVVAPDGRWLQVNRRLCEITGYSRDELLARRLQDLTHPQDLDLDVALMAKMFAGEIPGYALEKRSLRKDGTQVWIKLTATFVHQGSGTPEYGLAVVDDLPSRADVAPEEQRIMRYGPLILDLERLRVQLDGRDLFLTSKELMVLYYLMHHRGQVMSRERLLSDVWGYRRNAKSRTVDVHICRLRKKSKYLNEAILTVDRSGYKLSNPPPEY